MFGLTQRENEALHFLRAFKAKHGIFPSFDELTAGLKLKSKSGASRLLNGLEERGHIKRLPQRERAIEIVGDHPDVVFVNVDLPVTVQAHLTAFCEAHGERAADVIADAVALHLDQMDALLVREASAS